MRVKGKQKKQQAEMKTKSISHGHGELTLSWFMQFLTQAGVDMRINVWLNGVSVHIRLRLSDVLCRNVVVDVAPKRKEKQS